MTPLTLILRWADQARHGRRCRWCGGAATQRRTTCSAACRDQLSHHYDLGG